ncbi:hypothetical protein MASR2M29_21150 [Spirochaetota bacterium]
MKNKAIIFGLAILALLFISCEEGPSGIFYRVAHEKPLYQNQTKGLIGSIPAFVARLESTNYLGSGQLWSKADGSNTWTVSSSLPESVQGKSYFALSGVTVDSELYILFKDTNALDLGVFSFDESEWSSIAIPTGQSAQKLLSANNQLFLATTNNNACSLFYLNSSNVFVSAGATVQGSTVIGLPNSVAWDGANYWFTAGKSLLSGSITNITSVTSPSTAILGGIAAQGTSLVLSDKSGKLYASTDGTSWTAKAVDLNLSFTEPVFYDSSNMVVGTDAQPRSANDLPRASGYKEFTLSGTTLTEATASDLTDTTNFASSLADQKVSSMALIDMGSKKVLYALTYGDGLWANYFDGSKWSQWLRE